MTSFDDRAAVAHRGPHVDFGELLAEGGEQGGQVALGRDRACRNRQVARDARVEAAEALPRLLVQVEDSPGELIEPLARLGQGDATGPAVEERDPKLSLEGGDSLTHRRLGDAQVGRRVREAPPLRRPRERREVRELSGAGGRWGFGHRIPRPTGHEPHCPDDTLRETRVLAVPENSLKNARILLANSLRRSIGRNLGKMGCAGKGVDRKLGKMGHAGKGKPGF